jgi:hypothetical protein
MIIVVLALVERVQDTFQHRKNLTFKKGTISIVRVGSYSDALALFITMGCCQDNIRSCNNGRRCEVSSYIT